MIGLGSDNKKRECDDGDNDDDGDDVDDGDDNGDDVEQVQWEEGLCRRD